MSKDWNNQELQSASEQMQKQGNLGYEQFTEEITKQKTAQKYVDDIKRHYANGNLEKAYECWSKLYDLYEYNNKMTQKEREEQFKQLNSFTSQIDDNTVYAITDYGREKAYKEQDFYNDIAKENEEPDMDF